MGLDQERQTLTVQVVDDMLSNALMLKAYVSRLPGVQAVTFTDPVKALEWARSEVPDLILVDQEMPQMSGVEFIIEVRQCEPLAEVPVVVVTGVEEREVLYAALDAGANDYLQKPVDKVELRARARNMLKLRVRQLELAAANERLRMLATTDALTGVSNRATIIERMEAERARCERYDRRFCVALLDADRFKRVNDTWGHAAGDEVLKALATTLDRERRMSDMVGRLGGEEFLLLLPETPIDGAFTAMERIRKTIEEIRLPWGEQELSFTVSIGVAELSVGESASSLMDRADRAMYMAKNSGRNRVVMAGDGLEYTPRTPIPRAGSAR